MRGAQYAHNLILNSRGAHYAIACLYNTIHILKRCDLTVCHQPIGRRLRRYDRGGVQTDDDLVYMFYRNRFSGFKFFRRFVRRYPQVVVRFVW